MIGSHNSPNDITDAQGFSIQAYYEAMIGAIAESDIYPNSYDDIYTAPVSGAMDCAVDQETVMCMSCDSLRFIDLNESDLHCKMRYHYKLDAPTEYFGAYGEKQTYTYYIGPKRSFDIIGHYLLQSNNDVPFLDTVDSHFESFIDYIATINDGTADETTATVDKIRTRSPFVPGFYHVMSADHDKDATYEKEIIFRIPITDWHVMRDLRWFQSWMGELKFHIYPTVSKFCIMPCWSKEDIHYLQMAATTNNGKEAGTEIDDDSYIMSIACGFNQTDTTFKVPSAIAGEDIKYNTLVDCKLTSLKTSRLTDIELITRQNMLKPDVAAALQQSYLEVPLMFPILNWAYMAFSSEINKHESTTCATTLALQHCDTGFLLFRRSNQDLTCYINPEITWRLQIGSKLLPQKPYNTYDDLRFITMFYDGLNIKGNPNFKLQDSIYNSLQPYSTYNTPNADKKLEEYVIYNLQDRSNFCIPIPFTPDEWFQGGISQPNSPLKLTISGRRKHGDCEKADATELESFIQPIFAYCQDHILRIYSAKPGLAKQIDISTRSVGQILATGQA